MRLSRKQARDLARQATQLLDGRHGDPSKNASWIRERQLAAIVVALTDDTDIEVPL